MEQLGMLTSVEINRVLKHVDINFTTKVSIQAVETALFERVITQSGPGLRAKSGDLIDMDTKSPKSPRCPMRMVITQEKQRFKVELLSHKRMLCVWSSEGLATNRPLSIWRPNDEPKKNPMAQFLSKSSPRLPMNPGYSWATLSAMELVHRRSTTGCILW